MSSLGLETFLNICKVQFKKQTVDLLSPSIFLSFFSICPRIAWYLYNLFTTLDYISSSSWVDYVLYIKLLLFHFMAFPQQIYWLLLHYFRVFLPYNAFCCQIWSADGNCSKIHRYSYNYRNKTWWYFSKCEIFGSWIFQTISLW